ncbi:hypothetical protein [Daejeonella lutea]|uniref:Uncharacterized protein n=1 Tax=Daejeonella lutea TaxID=572036 RepID=A0A1T5CSZ9_9SPHI|nr:hypothetical protein [Daejeonella lutea]SKB62451.1 hypothetical protein SAMN05661099_1828 [Daejeonella lutea]
MTFEEFLNKKKIDLAQFKTAEPGLYLEFQSHYSQMGAKSFDHSKKFLFNKLRRAYHLKEEPKTVPAKEIIEVNEIASQAEPLLSPSVEATVYTPRFRATGTPKKEDEEIRYLKSESGDLASDKPKPAYTPRFKAQPAQRPEASPVEKTEQASLSAKPAFKPRFKPGMTGTTSANSIEENEEEIPADKPKPAYVPRFKASVTANPAEEKMEETPAVKPKPGYVPRFKAPAKANPSSPSENSDL